MSGKNKTVGRPKKYNLDTKQIEQLASFGCTNIEIASFFGCDESLIRKSYSEYIAKGRDSGKIRLRQYQWASAKKGNVAMLIWLGKQMLGQTDKQEITTTELPEGFSVELL